MIAHFIRWKGRGLWVLGMPFLIGILLFTIFSLLDINDRYVRDSTLVVSAVALLLIDNKKEVIDEGVVQKTGKRPKGINTFMWIEMRYWAIAMGLLGLILLVIK